MSIIKSLAVAAATALLAVTGASAQGIANPTGVVANVSFVAIQPLLSEIGATYSMQKIGDNDVLVVKAGPRTLLFRQAACSGYGNCAGLIMEAVINDQLPPEQMINYFNQLSNVSTAVRYNNALVLERYLIADYGITRGSLAVNIMAFTNSINDWVRFSQNASGQASTIAEQLNAQSLDGPLPAGLEGRATVHGRPATRSVEVVNASISDDYLAFANNSGAEHSVSHD